MQKVMKVGKLTSNQFWDTKIKHCMTSVHIRSFSCLYFPEFRLNAHDGTLMELFLRKTPSEIFGRVINTPLLWVLLLALMILARRALDLWELNKTFTWLKRKVLIFLDNVLSHPDYFAHPCFFFSLRILYQNSSLSTQVLSMFLRSRTKGVYCRRLYQDLSLV